MPTHTRPNVIGLRLADEELRVLIELQDEQGSSASEILRRAFRAAYPDRFKRHEPKKRRPHGQGKST